MTTSAIKAECWQCEATTGIVCDEADDVWSCTDDQACHERVGSALAAMTQDEQMSASMAANRRLQLQSTGEVDERRLLRDVFGI